MNKGKKKQSVRSLPMVDSNSPFSARVCTILQTQPDMTLMCMVCFIVIGNKCLKKNFFNHYFCFKAEGLNFVIDNHIVLINVFLIC